MDPAKPRLPLIDQREIEARIVGPLIRAFAAEIGEERTLEIVRDLIRELARNAGSELAAGRRRADARGLRGRARPLARKRSARDRRARTIARTRSRST